MRFVAVRTDCHSCVDATCCDASNTCRLGIGITLLLVAQFILPAYGQEMNPFDLDDLRWKHRVLIVFAPDDSHPAYRQLEASLHNSMRDFEDRDMVLVSVFGESVTRSDSVVVQDAAALSLRERFDVATTSFEVVLVGKDGGVKLRADDPDVLSEIYALIDTMPMRRREMRSRTTQEIEPDLKPQRDQQP